jgi:exodeoxyribonuclease V gamma subunit
MLIVHTSNRLESLADALAALLKTGGLPPFIPETVVTQSTGMSRWLSLSLADRLGVTSHIEFPFPAKFAEDELARILPGQNASAVFRREVLPWRIHSILAANITEAAFSELHNYAGNDASRLWQLCLQIAATFDRYIAHRPQMLREWDAGRFSPEEQWQAALWKALADAPSHPAARIRRAAASKPLPAPRCAIFGLSSLAPTYLEFLSMLSEHREVHLFMLAPTSHYWGDVQSDREKARFLAWCERNGKIGGGEHIEAGHPLLASLGKVGRDFHDALIDLAATDAPENFISSPGSSLLARLQNDILELRPHDEDRSFSPADESIRLHNCHSPTRELEVLHDQLLALFDKDRTLTPRDVLVTAPDIEIYAPFIDGVFGAPESDAVRFPYCIADRELRTESTVADAFLRAMELVDSRLPATAVLALLDSPAVHTKFGFSESDLPLLRQWVVDSGIRWGRDAAHRENLGLPATTEHTWKFGMDRLVLGFALAGDGTQLFDGILPGRAVEGGLADSLGRFTTFTQTLFEKIADLREPRSAVEWSKVLHSTLDALFESDHDFAEQWSDVATTIAAIAEHSALAGHTIEVPFPVIRDSMNDALSGSNRGSGFLRGGLTFCSLRPMRAIPHRVICMLGMNDGAFPRQDRAPAFDLTAAHPRPGDRSTRDDDRYLFLEALLSTRERLIISWNGQSAQDNSPLPPSVIVSELLEALAHAYEVSPDSLITKHRLQPFSPRYFESGPLFSYSAENASAAISSASRNAAKPFASPVSPVGILHEVTLDRLIEALTRPSRFFARERLGIELPYDEAQLEDVEPMTLSRLDEYKVSERLLNSTLRGNSTESQGTSMRASGILPHGFSGSSSFQDAALDAEKLAKLAAFHAPNPALEPVPFSIALGEWTLSGTLGIATSSGILSVRPAHVKGRHLLHAWIKHLALCAASPTGIQHHSILISPDETQGFASLSAADAIAELGRLLEIYASMHERPLPIFPDASHAFADYDLNTSGSKRTDPLSKARTEWFGAPLQAGRSESREPWNALVWRDVADPLESEFQELARQIFYPLLNSRVSLESKGATE